MARWAPGVAVSFSKGCAMRWKRWGECAAAPGLVWQADRQGTVQRTHNSVHTDVHIQLITLMVSWG